MKFFFFEFVKLKKHAPEGDFYVKQGLFEGSAIQPYICQKRWSPYSTVYDPHQYASPNIGTQQLRWWDLIPLAWSYLFLTYRYTLRHWGYVQRISRDVNQNLWMGDYLRGDSFCSVWLNFSELVNPRIRTYMATITQRLQGKFTDSRDLKIRDWKKKDTGTSHNYMSAQMDCRAGQWGYVCKSVQPCNSSIQLW